VVDLTIVIVRRVSRWLGRRRWVLIGDGRDSCVELGWECLTVQATLFTRRRLDVRLFAFPGAEPAGRRGRKPQKGAALAKLATRLDEAGRQGREATFQWYRQVKTRRLLSDTGLRHTPGYPPRPIRWVLVVDPAGDIDPQAFFTTDLTMAPAGVVALFVMALVAGGDLRGNPPSPRGGDPTPVLRPGHRPHHAGAARTLFAGLSDGASLAR
jgi:hypothetical protein